MQFPFMASKDILQAETEIGFLYFSRVGFADRRNRIGQVKRTLGQVNLAIEFKSLV